MTRKQLHQFVSSLFEECLSTHQTRNGDYAEEDDGLYNFKNGARRNRLTSKKYLHVLADKHLQAIENYCNDGPLDGEPLRSRVVDAINYLGLLLALEADGRVPDQKEWIRQNDKLDGCFVDGKFTPHKD